MLVTRHKGVAESIARLRAFGVDRSHTERAVPGMYDVVELGLNYRMSEIQAAMGRRQLGRIQEILERREENFKRLKSLLAGIEDISILDAAGEDASSSYYCLSAVLGQHLKLHRDEIISRLNEAGVGTSIYYPHPVPRLTYYKHKYGWDSEDYPEAVAISDGSIALPVGPHLAPADMDYIANCFTGAIKEVRG